MYTASELEHTSLYDWMCLCERSSDSSAQSGHAPSQDGDTDDDEHEFGTGDLDGDNCKSDSDAPVDPDNSDDESGSLDSFIVEDDDAPPSCDDPVPFVEPVPDIDRRVPYNPNGAYSDAEDDEGTWPR